MYIYREREIATPGPPARGQYETLDTCMYNVCIYTYIYIYTYREREMYVYIYTHIIIII